MRFNAYVDGFNLYKGLLELQPELKWLNLRSFVSSRWPEYELEKLFYFTARIKEKFSGDQSPRRQHAYLRALEGSGVTVVLGSFRKDKDWLRLDCHVHKHVIEPSLYDPESYIQNAFDLSHKISEPDSLKAFVWKYGEKGSDVNLASYLLRDSFSKTTSAALVISMDSDLATPISMAKEFGVVTKLLLPKKSASSNQIKSSANYVEEIHSTWLREHQFPKVVKAKNGKDIIRPREWL